MSNKAMIKNKLIVIDDEKYFMQPYLEAFTLRGYDVCYISNVTDAKEYLSHLGDYSDIAAILVDMMMSPDKLYTLQKSKKGIRTGALLAVDLRRMTSNTLIIILTNLSRTDIDDVDNLLNENNIHLMSKPDFLPNDIVMEIEDINNRL